MDDLDFDRLSKAIAAGISRRRALDLLASTALGGVLLSPRPDAITEAKPRKHLHHHRHAQPQQRDKDRHDTAHSEACIPTGKPCPSKKPRGKKGKKLSCARCCQRTVVTDAAGRTVCGCQPNGGTCTRETATTCCSGFCDGTTCQAAPCSAANPCPQCQTCNSTTGVCEAVANRTPCSGGNICCNGTCCDGCCSTSAASGGTCAACLVFVTSTTYTGDLKGSSASGLEGADAKCQAQANAATPPLPGIYKAWLSDATSSPSTRFRCSQASCSSQGYRLVDGVTVVATDWTQLTSCANFGGICLAHAIDRSEVNGTVGASRTWTHTLPDGTPGGAASAHCQNWSTSTSDQFGDPGVVEATEASWTEHDEANHCDNLLSLYCFQQS